MGLYPAWWRERYGDEVEVCSNDLVESGRSSWRINFGLFWGAVRTRVSARGMPATSELWAARARAWLIVATAPVLVVVPVFLSVRQVQHTPFVTTGLAERVSSDAYLIMLLAFVVLMFAAQWGYGSLSAGLEGGPAPSRVPSMLTRAPGRLTLLALALFIASVVVGPHSYVIAHNRPPVAQDGSPTAASALHWAAGLALLAGWAMVVPVLTAAVRRGDFSPWLWRSGRRVSRTVTAVLWVMAVASAVDGITFGHLDRTGTTFTVFGGSVWLLVGVLGAAAVVSSWGTGALAGSLRTARSLTTTV
jgi:hypothetical protein